MERLFEVTVPAERVRLGTDGRGQMVFTVTSRSNAVQRAGAKVVPSGDTRAEWLAIGGEAERELSPGGTDQYIVTAKFPPNTPPGNYPFRLRVQSTNSRTSEEYDESAIVHFEMPAVAGETTKRWWIWAAAAALLLVGGVVAFLLTRGGGTTVPDVTKKQAVAAIREVQGAQFLVQVAFVADPSAPPGEVLSTAPAGGAEADPGSTVLLTVGVRTTGDFPIAGEDARQLSDATAQRLQEFLAAAPPPPPADTGIDVPSLVGQNVVNGMETLQARGLFARLLRITSTQHAPNIVLQQDPTSGKLPAGSFVTLVIAQPPNIFIPIPMGEVITLHPKFRREAIEFNKQGSQ